MSAGSSQALPVCDSFQSRNSWALAKAGLLDGYECSVHWGFLAAMQEAFPRVSISVSLFSLAIDIQAS